MIEFQFNFGFRPYNYDKPQAYKERWQGQYYPANWPGHFIYWSWYRFKRKFKMNLYNM